MEKKAYVTPMAIEEQFAPNQYIASCTALDDEDEIRCINPYHNSANRQWLRTSNNNYNSVISASVFSQANCTTIISLDNPKTAGGYTPSYGATVYGADGTPYTCTQPVRVGRTTYYVPAGAARWNFCYGAYVNNPTQTMS